MIFDIRRKKLPFAIYKTNTLSSRTSLNERLITRSWIRSVRFGRTGYFKNSLINANPMKQLYFIIKE